MVVEVVTSWTFANRHELPTSLQAKHPNCGGCTFSKIESSDEELPRYEFVVWTVGGTSESYDMTTADRNEFLDILGTWDASLGA